MATVQLSIDYSTNAIHLSCCGRVATFNAYDLNNLGKWIVDTAKITASDEAQAAERFKKMTTQERIEHRLKVKEV